MLKVKVQRTSQELERRRQEALATAKKCISLLKSNFGAEEAFVCGSLSGETPWHWHSDLDLAVRGMTQDDVWNARYFIEDIRPHWLEVDIIPLEFSPSFLAERILNKTPMSDNKFLDLKLRIEDEMSSLEVTVDTLKELLPQQNTIPEVAFIPAIASYVVDFYTGCERISERVAVYLDGGIPNSRDWHLELLRLMAEPGGCDRPALWSGALLLDLSEYRKFRHLRRHNYDIKLDAERVFELGQQVLSVYEQVKLATAGFGRWLEKKGND